MELKPKSYWCLVEALRRFECFGARRDKKRWTITDLMSAWTGLGYNTDYRQAVNDGYMKVAPATGPISPRCMGWWGLTESGAQIVIFWHNQGYTCGDGYELKSLPKDVVPD